MIQFTVPGIPAPGGSKRAFYNKRTGRAMLTDDCKRNKDWRAVVAWTAKQHIAEPLAGAISVEVEFRLWRPKGHYGTGKHWQRLKASAPDFPTTKPDATKLWRAAEDALTGIAWADDAQVVEQRVRKVYGAPSMYIRICQPEGGISQAKRAIGVTL